MPRIARKKINTSFIHVMVQGVNKEFIFNDPKYLNYYLKSVKSESNFEEFDLVAYCMMNNHAHFLFHVTDLDCFSQFIKDVNQNFAVFYNRAENRVGVVFRNRFQVEPIYDINHLKNCIKYIHNNPVKAGMVKDCDDYPFSSYNDYLYGRGCAKLDILKSIFGNDTNYLKSIEESSDRRFIDFDLQPACDEYFETGINSFKKEYNLSLIEIMSERKIMQKLIKYLKKNHNLKNFETIKWLGVSRDIMRNV